MNRMIPSSRTNRGPAHRLATLTGLTLALYTAPASAQSYTLNGLVRDFRELSEVGGHPDMQRVPCRGFGHYVNIVDDELDADGKPCFRSSGCLIRIEPTDSSGRNIIVPKSYITSFADDAAGEWDCFGSHHMEGSYQGPTDVTGRVNLNPNNNPNYEFVLRRGDDSTITRDDLQATFEGYEGDAQYIFFRPKGNGAQNSLMLDGEVHELINGSQYEMWAPSMLVRVYNDDIRNGRAMGHWWLEMIDAENVSFWESNSTDDQDHSYSHSRDSGENHICNSGYPGGGAVYSPTSLATWFRDDPGLNVSKSVPVTLNEDPASGLFVFDDRLDPYYAAKGGFFPIDNDLFGNPLGAPHNYHFTYEIQASFIYHAGQGDIFSFEGDDDVFVYIDGHLVADGGGVHDSVSQTINLDRLAWLVDGEQYNLSFFFAQRRDEGSHLRLETSLDLRSTQAPLASALYD